MNDIRQRLLALLDTQRSLVLATTGDDGSPLASHAPFVRLDGAFHVFLSALSAHAAHVARGDDVSVMVIEDESAGEEIFARRRATFHCRPSVVEGERREVVLDALAARCGEVVATLRTLSDFALYRLEPVRGNYVEGFAQAFAIDDPAALTLRHRRRG